MGKRRLSRELTLKFLYQIDPTSEFHRNNEINFDDEYELFWSTQEEDSDDDIKEFMTILARGVCENFEGIDKIISLYSDNWRISRMAKIDLNIIRVAVYEMVYLSNIPPAVTINEAVEIAKKYGCEDSGAFINGILDRIKVAKEKGEMNHDFRGN